MKLMFILNPRHCKCGNYQGLNMGWDPQYQQIPSVWPFSPSVAHYEQWKMLNAHNDMDSCIRPEGLRLLQPCAECICREKASTKRNTKVTSFLACFFKMFYVECN
jgi:hypothetical protein